MLKFCFMEHHLWFSRPSQWTITLPMWAGRMVVVVNLCRHTGLLLPCPLCLKLFIALPLPWPMVNSLDIQDLSSSVNYHGSKQRFKRRSPGWRWGSGSSPRLRRATAPYCFFKSRLSQGPSLRDFCSLRYPESKDRGTVVPSSWVNSIFVDPLWCCYYQKLLLKIQSPDILRIFLDY